jgi:hypothetical protein
MSPRGVIEPPKTPFGHLCDLLRLGSTGTHPKKVPVFGGLPAKNTVERDVPKKFYGVLIAWKFRRPLPRKVTTKFLGTARPIFGPLGTISGRNSSLGDVVRAYVTTLSVGRARALP